MTKIILVGNIGRNPEPQKKKPADTFGGQPAGEASTEAPFDKSPNGRFPEAANDAEFPNPQHLLTLYAKVARGGYSVEREEYGPPGAMWFRVRRPDGVVYIHTLERLEALAERCEERSAERLLRNLNAEVLA